MYIPCRFLTCEKKKKFLLTSEKQNENILERRKRGSFQRGPMLIKNSFFMELGILKCNYIHFNCLESMYSFQKSNTCFPIFAISSLETVKSTFAIIETSMLSVYFSTHWERGQFIEFISPVRRQLQFKNESFHTYLTSFHSSREIWTQ